MKTIKKRSARQTRYQYMMIYFINIVKRKTRMPLTSN